MLDLYGRNIDYIRISVTDRCNLHCSYCMPEGAVRWQEKEEQLQPEEILRLSKLFSDIGIKKVKLTGGEPLLRKELPFLIRHLKKDCHMEAVTLTTNGILLKKQLDGLLQAGLDGVNISLDTLDRELYYKITGKDALPDVKTAIEEAAERKDLSLKLNCVLINQTEQDLLSIANLAKERKIAVRFIEQMPIGFARGTQTLKEDTVKQLFEKKYGALLPVTGKCGNGPAHYFMVKGFAGSIGFISAFSHKFCDTCNRVRLTSDGFFKPCLQYETGTDLKKLLRLGADDDAIREKIRKTIKSKPQCHQFEGGKNENTEHRNMSEIGG